MAQTIRKRITVSEVRKWLRWCKESARLRDTVYFGPWVLVVYRLAHYALRSHRRHRRRHGRVASLNLTATAIEKGRSPMGDPNTLGVVLGGVAGIKFTVTPKDGSGVPVTNPPPITWNNSNNGVLTVHESTDGLTATGLLVAVGDSDVTVTCGAVTDSVHITVTAPETPPPPPPPGVVATLNLTAEVIPLTQ